ncbi:phosphatidylinositol N-acetylglucosaminyltransferase subunit H [Musca domestica]|uniref:Phosphatidylinositol N-acetylglucosaminyltransferase subunit H n=1 Tax=Musca domestica TaxID=7370 RepID=A0A1I8MCW4_MUSDO|nr:phosphatidylinositol N-acetylglucosaminyltransferase subunit H [Musca domestica]XP_011293584.1 phosphatidylinositol N-acetylglucosaminyltransferase subunit H [Musca domestica]
MNCCGSSMIYEFHSTTHLYKGLEETDLRLEIHELGSDALQVRLVNKDFPKQKKAAIKESLVFVAICGFYLWLHLNAAFRLLYFGIASFLWFLPILWRWLSLVKAENIIFCHDFGINLQIEKCWGKSNTFISSSAIHDIRINEVLENFDFRYLLIIRTKGKLFQKRPIIPIFKVFNPTCDCLNIIYKKLNQMYCKTQ